MDNESTIYVTVNHRESVYPLKDPSIGSVPGNDLAIPGNLRERSNCQSIE